MTDDGAPRQVPYRRARFATRLPADRRYTASHFWIQRRESGLWRVGFTQFATRMLGEIVEHGFDVGPDEAVGVGQVIGWVEGFKAMSDLYCVVEGRFAETNASLDEAITLIDSDPYNRGWLYAARGEPDPQSVDVHGYVGILDATIDRMRSKAE